MNIYRTFEDYFAAQSKEHQDLINKLRRLVAKTSPSLEETAKWGNGAWVNGELAVMFVHCKEDYVQFGFYGGALLDDPSNLLKGDGEFVRHVRIESKTDIDEQKFTPLIKQASTLNYKNKTI